MKCPNCGTETSGKFCHACGEIQARPDGNCPACGAKLSAGKFCPSCGARAPRPALRLDGQKETSWANARGLARSIMGEAAGAEEIENFIWENYSKPITAPKPKPKIKLSGAMELARTILATGKSWSYLETHPPTNEELEKVAHETYDGVFEILPDAEYERLESKKP